MLGKLDILVLFLCIFLEETQESVAHDTDFLLVSNGSHILRVPLTEGDVHPLFHEGISRAVGLTIDVREDLVFWSDIGPRHEGIYKASLTGSGRPERIVQDVGKVNGLAVDWVSKHIYWTDESHRTLELCDYSGENRHLLVQNDLQAPRGVAVDPVNSYVYVGDQGAKKIERFRLDGTNRTVVVNTSLQWPNQLAINYYDSYLYWVDAYSKSLESCAMDGSDRRLIRSLSDTHYAAPLFGLAVVNHTAYVSTWYDGAVYEADLTSTQPDHVITQADYLTDHEMFSLAAHDINTQPQQPSECGRTSHGGCSHLCLMTSRESYRCACPTRGALYLSSNMQHCTLPKEILLYADKDRGQVGIVSLDDSNEPHILATSSMPVAIGYDPVEGHVFWSDVRDRAIYRVNLDGYNKTVFLNASQGIGTVDGLFVDWKHGRLYFSNMGYSSPKLDGAVYSWHRIEFIGLDGQNRKLVISNVEKPRGLAVDMENGYIYFSDWGSNPRVARSDLDGTNITTLMTSDNVSNPNGLSVKDGKLYVTDSNYNHRLRRPQITVMDLASGTFTVHTAQDMVIPYGIDVNGNTIFFTDWRSTEQHTGAILAYDVTSGLSKQLLSGLSNPAGLLYVSTDPVTFKEEDGGCHLKKCSHICVVPSGQQTLNSRCLCPDLTGLSLDGTGTQCHAAENFLLFTDLNTLRYIPLDGSHDRSTYTLHYGAYEANFVAIAYDPVTTYIYWSDLTRRSIVRAKLNSPDMATVFYKADMAVDGLALDHVGRRLYMTGYNVMKGVLASVSLDDFPDATYTELITDLDMPRAVALDLKNSYVYWSEYGKSGGKAKISRAYLDGTDNVTLYDIDLRWPNALAVSQGQLYLADGSHRRIDVFTVDGARNGELAYMTGMMDHVFGLDIYDNALYYTDWYNNSTSVVNLKTGQRETLAKDLYRPSAILVHHPQDLSVHNECEAEGRKCSDICIPIPGGYHCSCNPGSQLAEDHHTCIQGEAKWQVTNDFRCEDECAESAYCARMLSTVHYQCVCTEGMEGDGVTQCTACPMDTYKPTTGNETCQPCPEGSTTQDMNGSATCLCTDPQLTFHEGQCKLTLLDQESTNNSLTENDNRFTTAIPDDGYDDETDYTYVDENEPNDTESDEVPIHELVTTTISYSLHHPVFENCPMDEVVHLVLPRGAQVAYLDIPLYSHDYHGQSIHITGSHDIPPGARFHWKGANVLQPVHYTARDEFSQETNCRFSVIVDDKEAPTFNHCPGDIAMETTKTREFVYWEEPEVDDNINLDQIMPPKQESGTSFPVGKTEVSYKATDASNNTAWCNFTVHITAIRVTCEQSDVPEPRNGGLVCGENMHGFLCQTFCSPEKYMMNPLPQYHAVQCSHEGVWHERFPEDYVTKACLKTSLERQVERHMQFWFTGPCNPTDHIQHKSIISAFVRLLQEQSLCGAAAKGHKSTNICDPADFSVHCGTMDTKRKKREVPNNVSIHMKIEATASLEGNLTVVERLINDTASRIEASLDEGTTFEAMGKTYYSKRGWVTLEPVLLTCQPGTVTHQDHCLLCPVGTYSDLVASRCSDCPRGTYQANEGQATCLPCPDRATSPLGAYNISQCIASAGQRAHTLSGNSALILGVILAFFIVVGIIIIIVMLRRFNDSRHHPDGKRRHSSHDAAYIIQVQGKEVKGHDEDADGELEGETCHLRKDEESDDDDDGDDTDCHDCNEETQSITTDISSGQSHQKDCVKRKRKSSQSSKSKNKYAKEEICLEVKTFMFDDDKKQPVQS